MGKCDDPAASRSEAWASNPACGMDVCPWFFYAVLSCFGTGLETSWSLIQGVLPYVVKAVYEAKLMEAGAHWGCRATDDGDKWASVRW
jgi:hypothetical protein